MGTSPLGMQDEDDFRLSIAGAQEKTAFLQINKQWQLPLGPTPSSHIFKAAGKKYKKLIKKYLVFLPGIRLLMKVSKERIERIISPFQTYG